MSQATPPTQISPHILVDEVLEQEHTPLTPFHVGHLLSFSKYRYDRFQADPQETHCFNV